MRIRLEACATSTRLTGPAHGRPDNRVPRGYEHQVEEGRQFGLAHSPDRATSRPTTAARAPASPQHEDVEITRTLGQRRLGKPASGRLG